eukprot:1143871-Pelagomonas_calceolata.AAC.7
MPQKFLLFHKSVPIAAKEREQHQWGIREGFEWRECTAFAPSMHCKAPTCALQKPSAQTPRFT